MVLTILEIKSGKSVAIYFLIGQCSCSVCLTFCGLSDCSIESPRAGNNSIPNSERWPSGTTWISVGFAYQLLLRDDVCSVPSVWISSSEKVFNCLGATSRIHFEFGKLWNLPAFHLLSCKRYPNPQKHLLLYFRIPQERLIASIRVVESTEDTEATQLSSSDE